MIYSSITRSFIGTGETIFLYDGLDIDLKTFKENERLIRESTIISIALLEKLRNKRLIGSIYIKDILLTREQIEPDLVYLITLEVQEYTKYKLTKEEMVYMEGFKAFLISRFKGIRVNKSIGVFNQYLIDDLLYINYNHLGSVTNRVTMKDPNVQAMKKDRTREYIIARDGYMLLELDYSQLDIYSLAMLSNDSQLYSDLSNGIDMHIKRLKYIYGDTIDLSEEIWQKRRRDIKQFSFQLQYGASIESMSQSTGLSIETIKALIREENKRYSEVAQFKETIYRFNGEMKTHNSTLSLPYGTFNGAKNGDTLVAHLVQGLGAYVLYYAVAKITHYFDILFTVHDSIVLEVPEGYNVRELIEIMEDLSPIGLKRYKVEAKIGKDYYNLQSIN